MVYDISKAKGEPRRHLALIWLCQSNYITYNPMHVNKSNSVAVTVWKNLSSQCTQSRPQAPSLSPLFCRSHSKYSSPELLELLEMAAKFRTASITDAISLQNAQNRAQYFLYSCFTETHGVYNGRGQSCYTKKWLFNNFITGTWASSYIRLHNMYIFAILNPLYNITKFLL